MRGSARERAGARRVPEPRSLGRSLWGRPNPQDVAPGDRSTNAGGVHGGDTASASASRAALASPGSAPSSRPRRSKPRKRVSDAGPPTHKVDCENRFVLPTDPAKVPASDALGWPDLGVVPRGGRVSPSTRPRTWTGHDAPPSPAGGGGGPCSRAGEEEAALGAARARVQESGVRSGQSLQSICSPSTSSHSPAPPDT